MRIIISPAKKMCIKTDSLQAETLPVFMSDAIKLKEWIRNLSYDQAKKLWACSDAIASENYDRFRHMDLETALTPAILSYDGIQYTYMAPAVFEDKAYAYLQENLRILSGFYGILKPMDGVTPYRLEMQAKAAVNGHRNLYDYWGDRIYQELLKGLCDGPGGSSRGRVIINLASKEYSRCIEPYLQPQDRYITCIFGQIEKDKIVQKGVYAKMARGEMVRYMAENQIEDPEEIRGFDWSGYHYREDLSSEDKYVFIHQ